MSLPKCRSAAPCLAAGEAQIAAFPESGFARENVMASSAENAQLPGKSMTGPLESPERDVSGSISGFFPVLPGHFPAPR